MFVERQILHRVCGAANPALCLPELCVPALCVPALCVSALCVPALCFVYCLHYVSVLTIRHDHKQHDNKLRSSSSSLDKLYIVSTILPLYLYIYITCLSYNLIHVYIIFFLQTNTNNHHLYISLYI